MQNIKTIAIVGGGELAEEIFSSAGNNYNKVDIIRHSEFDITNQTQCNDIVFGLAEYDAVIITAGHYSNDLWEMALVNTVGPCYLIAKLDEVATGQKIVAVSSHGSTWTSWPDIPTFRLSYNINKLALKNFCLGLVQQGTSTNKITVFEPSKFQSKMSNYLGANITGMAHQVLEIVNNQMHVVHAIVK